MIICFLKTIRIFTETFIYLIKSYKKNVDLIQLKKLWAQSVLDNLGFKINVLNYPSNESKLILVGNHISYLDIIVLMAAHPSVVFLSKKEVASWPIIGQGAIKVGTIFVDRNSFLSRNQARQQIEKKITSAQSTIHLAGFPSGTTTLDESKPWKRGLFEIAESTKTQVLPFRLNYFPLRECAYIDDDSLFFSLMNLFKLKNKMITLEWGSPFYVIKEEKEKQIEQTKSWTMNQTSEVLNEKKAPDRFAHSLTI